MRNTPVIAQKIKDEAERLGSFAELARKIKMNQGQLKRYADLETMEITDQVAERLLPAIGMKMHGPAGVNGSSASASPYSGLPVSSEDKTFIEQYLSLSTEQQAEMRKRCTELFTKVALEWKKKAAG